MKSIFVLFLIFSLPTFGQITTDQLLSLRIKPIGELENYLTSNNWKVVDANEATDSTASSARFSYTKSNEITYLSFYESKTIDSIGNIDLKYNRISLYTTDTKLYLKIITRIKVLNFKMTKSKIKESEIRKLYKGGRGIAISIKTENLKDDLGNSISTYNIFIANNLDYMGWFEDSEFN